MFSTHPGGPAPKPTDGRLFRKTGKTGKTRKSQGKSRKTACLRGSKLGWWAGKP